jgi:hypothetical protein
MPAHFRFKTNAAPLIGPLQQLRLPGCIGAKIFWIRHFPAPPQIQPVGIPTSLHGDVVSGHAAGVTRAGDFKQIEILVAQIEHLHKRSGNAIFQRFIPTCVGNTRVDSGSRNRMAPVLADTSSRCKRSGCHRASPFLPVLPQRAGKVLFVTPRLSLGLQNWGQAETENGSPSRSDPYSDWNQRCNSTSDI